MNKHWTKLPLYVLLIGLLLLAAPPALADDELNCPDREEEERVLFYQEPWLRGDDVAWLQQRLAALGYYQAPVDGGFGPLTAVAVRIFQQDHGLPPTGRVDQATFKKMGPHPVSVAQKTKPPEGKIKIRIDLDKLKLTILVNNRPFKSYPVAVGKYSTPSPKGDFRITSKGAWGEGFGTRWLGLDVPWGIFGIHGTNKPYSIGTRASGGCIRMFNRDVEEIFPWIKVGTVVEMYGPYTYPPCKDKRQLKRGMSGPDVVEVQRKLKEMGFFWSIADGRYGCLSEFAVRYYQHVYQHNVNGIFNPTYYQDLGLTDDKYLQWYSKYHKEGVPGMASSN